MWIEERPFYLENMAVMNNNNELDVSDKLEISGNTIIIKNESDKILYILPSDKYFISTSPILSKTKHWYFTNQL